jgi:argininosuccinate synthase
MKRKIVLAYSGGLDTSVVLKWLQEKYNSDVVTVTLDIGQKEDLDLISESSKQAGAIKHYTIDAKKEFVENFIFPSIRANGIYEGKYPLGTALARPLIASKLVEIAEKEDCFAVSHGCTGKGNDQVRLDVTIQALNPDLKLIAPVREWNLSRDQEVTYAKSHGLKYSLKKSTYSIDQNIWGRSIEAGPLEDTTVEPPDEIFEWITPINKTPDEPKYIEIEFQKGIPTAIDGKKMNGIEIVNQLNRIAGSLGVGIIDHIEDRLVGIKSREVYEAPAALTLLETHRDLEKLVLTRNQIEYKSMIEQKWAWLVYSGLWVEPLRKDLDAFIYSTQERVTGKVRIKIFKGNIRVVSRYSQYSLYDIGLATYTTSSTFDQKAAKGFSDIWGLSSRVSFKAEKSKTMESSDN